MSVAVYDEEVSIVVQREVRRSPEVLLNVRGLFVQIIGVELDVRLKIRSGSGFPLLHVGVEKLICPFGVG